LKTKWFVLTITTIAIIGVLCACASGSRKNDTVMTTTAATATTTQTKTENATTAQIQAENAATSSAPVASPVEADASIDISDESEAANSIIVSDTVSDVVSGEVVITFDYEKQSGHASNQFAIWIEDADRNYTKTLYATHYTAKGGYENRPDSISQWVSKSNLASMEKSEVDAITGSTPKQGTQSYTWDLTDAHGDKVPAGKYVFFVEGSLRWKNRVLYTCELEIGGSSTTMPATAEFYYEGSSNQPALSSGSPESNMIGLVTVSYHRE